MEVKMGEMKTSSLYNSIILQFHDYGSSKDWKGISAFLVILIHVVFFVQHKFKSIKDIFLQRLDIWP